MRRMIYVATSNQSKIENFCFFFSLIDPEIQVGLVPDYVEVDETGTSLAENSALKVAPYKGKYEYPVISNDSGLFFDTSVSEIQDPVKVKRNALAGRDEKDLEQSEIGLLIFDFYRNVARNHGGSVACEMRDVFTVLWPEGTVTQEQTVRSYKLVDRDVDTFDIFHPLNSLRISDRTGKFMDEMSEAEEEIDKRVMIDALRRLIDKDFVVVEKDKA
ncbi:hypothetical protein JW887_05945 [Candidatus Dojkabacteria bacterium]|nr:hypothetical protein [Candidatus Dojkabacteria bacterium]